MTRKLTTGRAAVLTLTTLLLFVTALTAGTTLAAAQEGVSTQGNSTTVEHQLGGVDIVNVTWTDNAVEITVHADSKAAITVTDSSAIESAGSHTIKDVPYETYYVDEGETIIRFNTGGELVTAASGGEMVVITGDVESTLDILQSAPTVTLIQWTLITGGIGVILSLAFVVGHLKRKEQNTYREVFADERVKIDQNPVEGVRGKIGKYARENRYALLTAAAIVAYLTLVAAGAAPSPGDIWGGMSDVQRILVIGSIVMMLLSFPFVYILALRIWDPAREFVIDIDARDVLDPSLGSNGGLALNADTVEEVAEELQDRDDIETVAVYAGSPERVSQMRLDGKAAEGRTAGGKCHIVQEFDPKRNTGVGVWPGTANDVELISERSKIDGNREILRDESRMLRTLIGALPAIATASDTDAMRSVDREIRELASVNSDPMDSLLNRAASGTRFEGMYTDDEDGDGPGYEQVVDDPDSDEEDEDDDNQGDKQE